MHMGVSEKKVHKEHRSRHLLEVSGSFKNPGDWDFPGGAVAKNPPANAGDTGSSPGLGRSHMMRSN